MDKVNQIIMNTLNNIIDNASLINMYYEIGKQIDTNNIKTKELEYFLKQKYGITILFTERNLNNMVKFSKLSDINDYLELPWKLILILLKKNQDYTLFCKQYHPTKKQMVEYINDGKIPKKNETFESDDTLEEIIKLKKGRDLK